MAIFLVSQDGRLEYHNATGEAMLSMARALAPYKETICPSPRRKSIHIVNQSRCSENVDTLGLGNGAALPGRAGRLRSPILPLGRSSADGPSAPDWQHCSSPPNLGAIPRHWKYCQRLAASHQPAHVALAIADGQPANIVAADAGISMHALRKHLANVYEKTGMRSQSSRRIREQVRHASQTSTLTLAFCSKRNWKSPWFAVGSDSVTP
ncbi:MAG: hypothetical protein R3D29_11280 [Nitratireductor sp.]